MIRRENKMCMRVLMGYWSACCCLSLLLELFLAFKLLLLLVFLFGLVWCVLY
ncbi:hypothetical protein ACE6H2_015712 [Prunus campanulata]